MEQIGKRREGEPCPRETVSGSDEGDKDEDDGDDEAGRFVCGWCKVAFARDTFARFVLKLFQH